MRADPASCASSGAARPVPAERYSSVELADDPLEVRTDRPAACDELPVHLS
ncbi:hypothetical protein [Streptomyces sp. SAS_270]|uniref:hypothetical protein n=1 Tax=Streptomyces sp. SAS_270 TaxID=3412748 RepID=UPI00403C7F65